MSKAAMGSTLLTKVQQQRGAALQLQPQVLAQALNRQDGLSRQCLLQLFGRNALDDLCSGRLQAGE
jgi:hypothetical protein